PTRPHVFPYTTLFRSQPRPADEIRERVRGPPEQLLQGGDDAEGLVAAGQAPARLPVAERRDAHGAVARAQALGDDREGQPAAPRSEEHTSELQSRENL